jgi:hypothetical protein
MNNDFSMNTDFPTNDWMDSILVKTEPHSETESLMLDRPAVDPNQDLFWDCLQDAASAPSTMNLDIDHQWPRSPFEMDEFTLPEFPPPRLTCPLVPLRRITPAKASPPPPQLVQHQIVQVQPQFHHYPPQAHCLSPCSTTVLQPQAQVFSLPYGPMQTLPDPSYSPFGESLDSRTSSVAYRPVQLNCDISRTLSNAKYSELFTQWGAQLLVDRHPQWTLQDINNVLKTGYIYFLKNVKTIVPRIGHEWRFISHVRAPGPGESSDRSYNLLGPIPLRCKVKEWLVGGDLWRMYHFVQGKTSKTQTVVH